jgi:hypothetical protein
LGVAWNGGSNGRNIVVASATAADPPATRAHQRQRGEGSDPVGVNSRTNWRAARAARMLTPW